jgi:hypothetical protein|nr:MAG TPA: Lower collar protein [Caudoviricetes sp.]
MSKYTTEVRYICEQKAGLQESVGFNNINSVLDKSWDKIFTTNWEIFDESYRKILCEKILRSYYTREICAETVGLWQLWLDSTLCEIMPMYNQLYKTTIYEFNPLYNTDMTTTFTKTVTGNDSKTTTGNSSKWNDVSTSSKNTKTDDYTVKDSSKTDSTSKGNTNSESSNNDTSAETNKFNDTPQGGVNGIESGNYLTDIRMISRTGTTTNSSDENSTSSLNGTYTNENLNKGTTVNEGTIRSNTNETGAANTSETGTSETTETWTEKVMGKNNSENYGQLLVEFRKSIINIDKMIIDELKPLFMQLW